MCEPGAEDTEDDDPCKGVAHPLGDPCQAPEHETEHQQDAERPDEAELLSAHAEDEVRVLLRQEREPLLRPEREPLAEEPAAPDRDPRLDHVPPRATRI